MAGLAIQKLTKCGFKSRCLSAKKCNFGQCLKVVVQLFLGTQGERSLDAKSIERVCRVPKLGPRPCYSIVMPWLHVK